MKTYFWLDLRLVGQHNDISWNAVLTVFLEIAVDAHKNNNTNNNNNNNIIIIIVIINNNNKKNAKSSILPLCENLGNTFIKAAQPWYK